MRLVAVTCLCVLGSVCSSGCLARQVAADGCGFRQALLDMYADQVMDNLIHAAENRALVQLSYRALTVTDIQYFKASVGGEIDPTSSKTLATATLAVLSTMQSVTSKLLFGTSLERDRQMQIYADPVVATDDVYTYYLAFAHDPTLFVCSDTPPPCPVHVQKKCGHKWYWVPEDAAGVFLQLALHTTFMRGTDPPPPVVWATTIQKIETECGAFGEPLQNKYVVYLAPPVPNDKGLLFIDTADGKGLELPIQAIDQMPYKCSDSKQPGPQQQGVKGPPRGTQMGMLYTQAAPDVAKQFGTLTGQSARFYSENYPNKGVQSPDRARLEEAVQAYQAMRKAAAAPPAMAVPVPSQSDPMSQRVPRLPGPGPQLMSDVGQNLCRFGCPRGE